MKLRSGSSGVAALLLALGMGLYPCRTLADIIPIGPFVGERSEPLNFGFTTIVARFPIFQGAGALESFDGHTTVIHLLLGDTFGGDHVGPRTGPNILGFTQGPGVFRFDPPVRRFGGYFNNNSGADDAAVEFFNTAGTSLGIRTATIPAPGTQWVWNGWESDTPFATMTVTGNGVIQGFLWFDDMEISTVPAPASAAILAAMGVLPLAGRQSRRPAIPAPHAPL